MGIHSVGANKIEGFCNALNMPHYDPLKVYSLHHTIMTNLRQKRQLSRFVTKNFRNYRDKVVLMKEAVKNLLG